MIRKLYRLSLRETDTKGIMNLFYQKPFQFYSVREIETRVPDLSNSGIKSFSQSHDVDWCVSLDNCACPVGKKKYVIE
jgi:hypothetical protein